LKNGYIYTICFMLALTIILGTGLALANDFFNPLILSNRDLAEKKAVLYAFALDTTGSPSEIEDRFTKSIQAVDRDGLRTYVRLDSTGIADAFAVPFSGPGLWGTIKGYLAVSKDRQKILGIVFTEQNETPGLGGRIDEAAFKEQFRDLPITAGEKLAYGAEGGGKLDAIAGATQSSRAVLQIVNTLIDQGLPGLEAVP
jgi:Na+-transporting NADH:ubiquinone oxidoreductase subunit C